VGSGTYYVDAGNEEKTEAIGARVIFADENAADVRERSEFRRRHYVEPVTSLMLMFPSFLGHSVEPHFGSGTRISIAFNLKHPLFTSISYEMEKRCSNRKES
jgi:hypothetical protein